eukprot:GHVO01010275.1.p1 GENE.GHVO01010275.1~~GHVO01010275.1.p1  ORF type:complete len:113 (+),score=14.98 GHVO01010275.1:160-498(+)
MNIVLANDIVVSHFSNDEFERCKILDHHLDKISRVHRLTRFVKVNAPKAPFMCSRLGIQILPSILIWTKGINNMRMVGFADFGCEDDFPTSTLARVLYEKEGIMEEPRSSYT